jgi:ZIP family zinc transporter
MIEAFLASALAGSATCLGSLPLFFFKNVPHRIYDGLLGMSAGIMISASALSLISPALDAGHLYQVISGLALGVFFMLVLENSLPHLEPHFSPKALTPTLRRGVLVATAITIHNFPEGFSSGVGYYSLPPGHGLALAVAIAIQNIPEGLAVALPLRMGRTSRSKTFFVTLASGLAEPVAGFIGILLVSLIKSLLPYALSFAGGAMLYVTFLHLIPESYSHKNEKEATIGAVGGLIIMLFLEFVFHP